MSEVEWGTMPPYPTARVSYDTALELVSPDGPTFIFTGDVPTCPSRSLESRFGVDVKRITAEEFRSLRYVERNPVRVGLVNRAQGVVESFSAACRSNFSVVKVKPSASSPIASR